MKDNYIRFEWAIRRFLRQKANWGVLEGFLFVFLNEKVEIIELPVSKSNCRSDDDYGIDIKAKNSRGEIIFVEVRNIHLINYYEEYFYQDKSIIEDVPHEEDYSEVKKIYSINIFYFDIGTGNDYLYRGQDIFTGVNTGDCLVLRPKIKNKVLRTFPPELFPEYYLIRVNEFNKAAVTPLEEWIKYIRTGSIRLDTTVPGLDEVRKKFRYYDVTPEERYAHDKHLDAVMIQNDVLECARLEGLMKARKESKCLTVEEMVVNMKNVGLDFQLISDVTGLTIEKIKEL